MTGESEGNELTGRLGRFNRRFEGLGGAGSDVRWMEGVDGGKPLTKEQLAVMKKSVWTSSKTGGGGGRDVAKKGGPGSGRRK